MLDIAVQMGKQRRDLDAQIWKMWAYIGRYGHQPVSELRCMTLTQLVRFSNELSDIVKAEHGPKE